MDKDLMLLTDVECDNYVGALLAKGFESDEYTSAVEAMYGAGFESAFVDDGFFASLKRGIRNLTTFKYATKISNAIKDIRNLSVEKISQGDTRGVTFDGKSLDILLKAIGNRAANVDKVKEKLTQIAGKVEALNNDPAIVEVLAKGTKDAYGKKTVFHVISAAINGAIAYLGYGTLKKMPSITAFTTGGDILFKAVLITGFLNFALSCIVSSYRSVRAVKRNIMNSETKNNLTEAEQKALNTVNEVTNDLVEALRTLAGININSTNLEKDLDNVAKKDGLLDLKTILSNKTKTITYDDKVKVVQSLQQLAENEDSLKATLDARELKTALNDVLLDEKGLKASNVSIGEAQLAAKNSKLVVAYAMKSSELLLSAIIAALDDCKRY